VGRGKRVLDFGAGSGVAGIAAVKAGALEVVACDLDPLAIAACRANAELNDVQMGYSTDFFAEADRFDLILVADVLYDRANLPLLDEFLSRGREALVADSRVRDFRHPLYRRIEMLEAMTLPDLAEPEEFRHVSLYHARRLTAKSFASKRRSRTGSHRSPIPCRSGLAREGAGPDDSNYLPAPYKPYSCPIHAFTRSPMSQQTPYIFDATTADFEQSVIENSFHKPVLVDFWAEWCAPCKVLMPMLQGIAESYQGELLLAKVNCDVEQDIVARFGIRSLPTVVLFKDGQPVDGFAGAQPESAVRACLNRTYRCHRPRCRSVRTGSGAVR
jgi:thioredoxin